MTSAVYVATARMSSAALSAALPQRVELGMLLAASCFGSTSLGRSSRWPCVRPVVVRHPAPSVGRRRGSCFPSPCCRLSPVNSQISHLLLLSLAPAHPRLPSRYPSAARKRPARQTMGIAHGVAIGVATVTKTFRGRPYVGIVDSFRAPWFHVTYSDGDEEDLHGLELARLLNYRAATFYEPEFFSYDFSVLHPATIPGWCAAMREFCALHGLRLPPSWLDGVVDQRRGISTDAYSDAAELADLQARLSDYVASSRAPRTWKNLRNPGLRVLWFLATRRIPLPPSAEEAALMMTKIAHDRDNAGAVSTMHNALTAICELNGWRSDIYNDRLALAPLHAMRRAHRKQTKKSEGLRVAHISSILTHYVFGSQRKDWTVAIGTAISVGFNILLRYDDLRRCRWDDGYCDITPLHVRFYLDGRKNNQYRGNMLDVAVPADPHLRGVYHACKIAKNRFKSGFVLPHVASDGTVDSSRAMNYERFVAFLRSALIHIGVSEHHARRFAGQSMRSGGATAAAISGLSPAEICHLAGVKDVDWLSYYNRNHLSSRLRASRAVGL